MRHELLAPAGSYAVCEAVITAGADAVYLGGDRYSARAFAPNFSDEDILRALDFAHLRGKKIYLAVNTLLKNRETGRELSRYIGPFYEHGLDAIIVQDYGVFQFVKRYFPGLPVHISTQMSVAGTYGAEFLREKGAKRIIPARELSLEEIRRIHDTVDVELECFVHGALCYCYSGQCLMSSLIGGRSGNRGRCAQPCRLPYQVRDEEGRAVGDETSFPLSLKDLCAIDLIPQLCEAGVHAFKIEGRMKSLAYAAGVTKIYRRYLDLYESISGDDDGINISATGDGADRSAGAARKSRTQGNDKAYADRSVGAAREYSVSEEDRRALTALGNRSGFTKGYYEMHAGSDMLTRTDSSHTSGDAEKVYEPEPTMRIRIAGTVSLCPGQPMELTVWSLGGGACGPECTAEESADAGAYGPECMEGEIAASGACDSDAAHAGDKIKVTGDVVQAAKSRPLSDDDVRAQITKTGETPFEFTSLRVEIFGDCFVPVGKINELRRCALAQLEESMLRPSRREPAGGERGEPDDTGGKNPGGGAAGGWATGRCLDSAGEWSSDLCIDAADGWASDRCMDSAGGWAEASGEAAAPLKWTPPPDNSSGPGLDVMVCTREQLETALDCPFVDMISLDLDPGSEYPATYSEYPAPDSEHSATGSEYLATYNVYSAPGREYSAPGREYSAPESEYPAPGSACRQQGGPAAVEEARARIAASGKRTGFCFPYVFRADTSDIFEREGWAEVLARFDALWVRSYDSLGWCLAYPGIARGAVRLDAGMYVFSVEAENDFLREGIGGYTAAAELNAGELAHMDNTRAELCIYGYTPVMVSAQCIYKNCGGPAGCDDKYKKFYLSDRYFNKFYAKRNCRDCYNVIYNSRPLFLLHRADEIRPLGFGSVRISFTQEDGECASKLLEDYRRAFIEDEPLSAPDDERSYTNGHFRRGVE